MKKFGLLLSFLLLTSCGVKEPTKIIVPTIPEEKQTIINFYCQNDVHGRIEQDLNENTGSVAQLSSYILNKQKSIPGYNVYLNAGDLWEDTYNSVKNKGALLTECYRDMNFDAMALGNHEFDWGTEVIKENQKLAKENNKDFTFLGANIYYFDEKNNQVLDHASDFCSKYKIIQRGDYKIGIIGAIGVSQIKSITSTNWTNLTFLDPVPIVKNLSDDLKVNHGCDVVVYLFHGNLASVGYEELSKISSVSKSHYVDVGFLGHSHVFEDTLYNGVPWVQNGSHSSCLGRVSIDFKNNEHKVIYKSSRASRIDDGYGNGVNSIFNSDEDINIRKTIDKYLTEDFKKLRDEVIGCLEKDYFDNNFGAVAANLYNIAIDDYLAKMRKTLDIPEIDVILNNGYRSNVILNNKDITRENVFNSMPFLNNIVVCKVKGSDIINECINYSSVYYLPKKQRLIIEKDKDYIVAGCDYVILHKNLSREYDYFKSYNGAIAIFNKYPNDLISDYIKEQGVILYKDLKQNNVEFCGLSQK